MAIAHMTSHQQWHEQIGRHAEWIADYERQQQEQDMKLSQMKESKYLRQEDVGDGGKLLTIRAYEKQNVAMEGQPEQEKWVMYFEEEEKGMVLGPTNIDLLAHALGTDEQDDTIGKQIVVYRDPTVSMGGKLVGGIRVRRARVAKPNGNGTAPARTSPAAALAKAQAPKAPPPPEEGDPGYMDDGDIPF